MIGSLLKYGCVALIGAVGFSIASHYMDSDTLDRVKEILDDHHKSLGDLPPEEITAKMRQFIADHRKDWTGQMTFAAGIKDLEDLFKPWQ